MVNQFNTEQLLTFTRSAIAAYLVGHREQAISLLRSYGATIDDNISDQQLSMVLLKAVNQSPGFRNALKGQLQNMVSTTVSNVGADGYSNYIDGGSFMSVDATTPASTTATPAATTQNKSYLAQVFSADTISNILGTGLNILNSSIANKTAQQGSAAALQQEAANLEATKLAAIEKEQQKEARRKIMAPILVTIAVVGIAYLGWRYYKKHKK